MVHRRDVQPLAVLSAGFHQPAPQSGYSVHNSNLIWHPQAPFPGLKTQLQTQITKDVGGWVNYETSHRSPDVLQSELQLHFSNNLHMLISSWMAKLCQLGSEES